MLKLPIIHKNRRPWAKVVKITFILSIILLFGYIWIEDSIDQHYQKILIYILLVFLISSGIIMNIPIKKHREVGMLILTDISFQFLIFHKVEEIALANIEMVEFNISGHWGQDVSVIPRIIIADGTGNFMTIKNRNLSTKKVEFYLEGERTLNTLRKYIEHIKTKTEVKH